MLHRTARLTPYGRQLLVERILIEGWPAATAAETLGVSRATAYKWLRRYAAEGPAGLEDRSARPQHQPRALPERQVRRILWPAGDCASARIAWGHSWVIPARPCTACCAGTERVAWPTPID